MITKDDPIRVIIVDDHAMVRIGLGEAIAGASDMVVVDEAGSGLEAIECYRKHTPDVVVMDIGAEYRGYSADVTRTAPVSGHFSREQRLIYEAVLEAQEAAIAAAVAAISAYGNCVSACSMTLTPLLCAESTVASP